jgi:Tol biopolymer transport system component
MDPAGKDITELLPGQPASGKNMADISPDHTKVVFQDWPDGNAKIYEVGLDGNGFRIVSTPCDCSEGDPAYSPDGKKIVFERVTGDTRQLMIRDLATGKVSSIKGAKGTWATGETGDSPEHPSWSPDGRTIIYALMHRAADGDLFYSQLYTADLAAGTVAKFPVPPDLRAGEPRYSPDGTLILFASDSAETSLGKSFGDIYTIHADGTQMRNLTDGSDGAPAEGTGASWTPDGKHILYMEDRIWLMDPDGGNKRLWSRLGPDVSTTERGFGYTTYWIP